MMRLYSCVYMDRVLARGGLEFGGGRVVVAAESAASPLGFYGSFLQPLAFINTFCLASDIQPSPLRRMLLPGRSLCTGSIRV